MDRRTLLAGAHAAALTALLPTDTSARTRLGPFPMLMRAYFVGVLRLNPVTATYLGGDAFDPSLAQINASLRDYTTEGLQRERRFYSQMAERHASIPRRTLNAQNRVDYELMAAQLAFIRRQLEETRYHERAIDTYVAEPFRGIDWQIQQMTDAGGGRLGTQAEWVLLVRRLEAVPPYVRAAVANLQAGLASGNRADWRMAQRDGAGGSASNAAYFQTTLPELAKGYLGDRAFAADVLGPLQRAAEAAANAYKMFGAWISQAYGGDRTDRFAAGTADYEWRVRNNLRDPRSAAELFAYGQQQVALYQGKMYEVAQVVAREAALPLPFETLDQKNAAVRAVMTHLSSDSPRNDQELRQWYVEAGRRAVQYGRDQQLFSIPAEYRLDVMDTPPVLRSAIDAAYYPAPPFKASGVGRFYLTPTGDDPTALKLNNRASVADTAIHEGFPGHDWHFKYMTEHKGEISPIRWLTPGAVEDSSAMWSDSPAIEGWGLYSEELMSEPAPGRPYGFYSSGEYLYELQGQLMRAVRIVVDVGIHTGRMSFDEAVDYFVANHGFYPGARQRTASDPTAKALIAGADRAIYRYSKWPTQAITYNLGKSAILSLREAYKMKLGTAYSAKAFHERFMRMGPIPTAYFRELFLTEG